MKIESFIEHLNRRNRNGQTIGSNGHLHEEESPYIIIFINRNLQ